MRVKMNGNAHLVSQSLYQLVCSHRVAKTGHILDREQMGSHLLELLGHIDVVGEQILLFRFVRKIARKTDGRLAKGLCLFVDGFHSHLQVRKIVQGIKYAKHVHAGLRGMNHELLYKVVGIIRVTHGIGTAKKHLKKNVGNFFTKSSQPLVGTLPEKTHAGVESGSAPHFQTE